MGRRIVASAFYLGAALAPAACAWNSSQPSRGLPPATNARQSLTLAVRNFSHLNLPGSELYPLACGYPPLQPSQFKIPPGNSQPLTGALGGSCNFATITVSQHSSKSFECEVIAYFDAPRDILTVQLIYMGDNAYCTVSGGGNTFAFNYLTYRAAREAGGKVCREKCSRRWRSTTSPSS